jgi:hypothetical protein
MTGGDPGVTGFYYDDTYNYDVFPAGTTKCVGPAPGGQTTYDNTIDVNTNRLDAGQGLKGLPGSILQMTSNLRSVINPAVDVMMMAVLLARPWALIWATITPISLLT